MPWSPIEEEVGVLCGADAKQEWLLPFFWERYRAHHTFPVTFCDFGMSQKAKRWCAKRGRCVVIPKQSVAAKEKIAAHVAIEWEAAYSPSLWQLRPAWFQKPRAFLKSSYRVGIWIDLDCEILRPIDPLFSYCDAVTQIGILRDFIFQDLPRFHPDIGYNSGVVVFQHGAPLIESWAELSRGATEQFWGDEALLSYLIAKEKVPVEELPGIYNWRLSQGIDINAVIVHWVGSGGKEYIRRFGGLKPSLAAQGFLS